MIHPHTRVAQTNSRSGYGVFATEFIPKGTIIYIQNSVGTSISLVKFYCCEEDMQQKIRKCSYSTSDGYRKINFDFGDYFQKAEHSNILDTNWGFEIAVENIQIGEEITRPISILDYTNDRDESLGFNGYFGQFNHTDFQRKDGDIQQKMRNALLIYPHLVQPLAEFLKTDIARKVMQLQDNWNAFKPVVPVPVLQLKQLELASH